MDMKTIAEANSPTPKEHWLKESQSSKLMSIRRISGAYDCVEVVEARDNGNVVVRLLKELDPGDRGTLLLDYEFYLKNNIDEAITVWLEPLGDKSTLRRLRGIEVKV